MLRLSKLADYATVLLVQLGQQRELATVTALAAMTGLPAPTVAKLLKRLTSDGFVSSHRGVRGGYRLNKPLSEISIAAVITSVDGPIEVTSCVNKHACDAHHSCRLFGQWNGVNAAITDVLTSIKLSDMLGELFVPASARGLSHENAVLSETKGR